MLSAIVALCAGVAVVAAYSVTPNVAVGIGGTADEAVMGVAGDVFGSYYAVGWTTSALLNSSFAAGGPAVTTYYAVTYAKTGEAKNGFITKYSKYGVPMWSAWVGGVKDQTVNAVAVSTDQTTVVVCGSYNGSDAYIGYSGVLTKALSASQQSDVFVAGFNASTGALIWSFASRSSTNDECLTIAEYNGLVAYGGYAQFDPTQTALGGRFRPEGVARLIMASVVSYHPNSFVGLCATADGNSGTPSNRRMSSPALTHNAGARQYAGITHAVTFDSAGNLWTATSIETSAILSAGYTGQVDTAHDVSVVMYLAEALTDVDQSLFESSTTNLNSCTFYDSTANDDTFNPDCVGYPGVAPLGVAAVMNFGSNGDDIVTGISVQNAQGDTTANMSRVVLTGYTVGATAGSKFHLQKYIESTNTSFWAEHSGPDTAFDFTLPHSGEVGWWLAQKGTFNGDSGAAFYGKALPPGLSGRINAVTCDPTTMHCVAAAALAGNGTVSVLGSPRQVVSAGPAGSYDAFVMRVDAGGNIVWMEQTGGAGNDSANAVVLFSGAGLVRPGQWVVAGGAFAGVAVVTPTSASPIVVMGLGGIDGLMVSYDDVDDCGLDPTYPVNPYGPNACGLVSGNLNALGASLCLDEPGFPLCFCHMNVTNGAPGTFCNRRGWNCGFMAQYYYGLLDMCSCPPATMPHANPLLDVAGRLQSCAGNVCQFGALTGEHANCLPLVLDLMSTCGASPDTPDADKVYIGLFKQFYDGCGTAGGSSSTAGADCTGFDFCAAPRAAAPASALVTAVATAAAALLIASNVRRSYY